MAVVGGTAQPAGSTVELPFTALANSRLIGSTIEG